jgi:hypothetical protein
MASFPNLTLVTGSIGTIGTGSLASDPTTGTTLTLTTGHGARFPAVLAGQEMWLQCENELMKCTAHTANADTLTVVRGQDGTTNAAHAALTAVYAVQSTVAERHYIPGATDSPRQHKLIGWSTPPDVPGGGIPPSAGVLYVARIYPQQDTFTMADLLYYVSVAGVGSPANCFVGVYSKGGTLLAKCTTDQATVMQSTGTKVAALTVEGGQSLTQTVGQDDYLWGGVVIGTQSATTIQLARAAGASAALANFGLAQADPYMCGSILTGLTAMPASFTPGSLTVQNKILFGIR